MRHIEWTIPPEYSGRKLLTFLRGEAGLSSRLTVSLKHVDDGILVNGVHARTVDIVRAGDIVAVNLPDSAPEYLPGGEKPDVLYENEDVLVINKPAGIAVHPSHNHQGDTIANMTAAYLACEGRDTVFRAVGRLDKNTSGALVCALNPYSAARLTGKISKQYLAVACGCYEGEGTIDKPIIRPDPMKTLRAVGGGGLPAVTHWKAVATDGRVTLLRIVLETGRTHQIRVHFAAMGTPLLADEMYGAPDLRLYYPGVMRTALHCMTVAFDAPVGGERLVIDAPLPDDLAVLAKTLGYPTDN